MGVLPEIAKAVEEMDWRCVRNRCRFNHQAAETGSGKTGAFCLPVLQIVYETLKDLQEGKSSGKASVSASGSASKHWKMNVYDRGDAMAIGEDGLLCQARDQQGWHGTRSNKAVFGK
uniref:Uncharacterized protein n=1 Tax=Biomphalaria glabrata TaxID=6526 RepID=A0A2C9M4X1_BIOGL